MIQASAYLYRLWDQGQRHLAAGRYVAARALLERAAAYAWRAREARCLARMYLPLLEVRRLIRHQAAEGQIVITEPAVHGRRQLRQFQEAAAGTFLMCDHTARGIRLAHAIHGAARRTGRRLEVLLLVRHGHHTRLAAPRDPTFAAGLGVSWTRDPSAAIAASTDPALIVPLPPPGTYDGHASGLGALARESVLIAWEALALRWQSRHPLFAGAGPWEELLWLREALEIDPACEPITLRLIALAEGVARR